MRPRRVGSPRPGYTSRAEGVIDADEKLAYASTGDYRRPFSSPAASSYVAIGEWKLLAIVVAVAMFVRLHKLSEPNSVVFDEVHFGKFASKYIKTQYYVDVHPPLAKLLLTFMAFIRGYDGNFDFKEIGKMYEDGVPYVSMRLLPAIMGVGVVPLGYLTLRGLGCGVTSALLGATFALFENGMVTQSRHILLDSPLIFFTALTAFCWVSFNNENKDRSRHFSEDWWLWLLLSGLSLGAVVSVKWVGLFTIATVGVDTIRQLWNLLGDLKVTPRQFARHFIARALCLIVVPILFYMAMFAVHFQVLQNSGEGDGFMSAAFQHTLGGHGMDDTFADIAIGSEVSIRHINTQGGYLHSHDHPYPAGSHQQQITLYPHRDENNIWRIVNATDDQPKDFASAPFTPLKDGMIIRLEHITTGKRLHSHNLRPPVSDVEWQNEVSGYGFPGFVGDANDNWQVEIEHGASGDPVSSKRMRTLHTTFRLKHILTGCYLFSHKVKLPEWGFEQQEVTCNTNAVKPNSLWYAETNNHPLLGPESERTNYILPGFFAKFWELQQVMWTTNAGLTDRHTFDSRPQSWPLLRRGINFWVKDHRHIYLIGNPFVWWMGTTSVVLYAIARAFLVLREKRGYQDFTNTKVVKYEGICTFLALGWALHYLPFFLMQRQLFLHHYFPALYFSILLATSVFDLLTASLRPRVRLQIGAVVGIVAIYNFMHFAPLAYGSVWTRDQCSSSKWLKTWDFSCNEFFADKAQYGRFTEFKNSPAVPVATVGGHVVEDPMAGQKAAEEAAPAVTEGLAPAVAPGPNIFEQNAAEKAPASSVPAANPVPMPPVSEVAPSDASVPGVAPPLPLEPDDLITSEEDEKPAPTPAVDIKVEEKVPAKAESHESASAADDNLERVQHELYAEAHQ